MTVAPPAPNTDVTDATLPWPKALSWVKTVTFLPCRSGRKVAAVATSWYDCRPDRKVYLLMPVSASVAAGPEMNSTWFSAASGATWAATPG